MVPSFRLARELRYCFDFEKAQSKQKVWVRPQIQSYEQWLQGCYRALSAVHPELTARSIVSNDTLTLIAQQRAPDKEVEMHAAAITDAWQITWDANLWVDFQDIRSTENGELCDDWFKRLRRFLKHEHLITTAEISQVILNAVERHDWRPQNVLRFGFKELNPAQRLLFHALAERGLLNEADLEDGDCKNDADNRLQGYETATEEFSALAAWAREKLATCGSDVSIGIVVNGLGKCRHIVKRSFENMFPEVEDISRLIAIDAGQPLNQHRLYLDFITLLKWTREPMSYVALVQLAKSPYFPRLKLFCKPQRAWFKEQMSMRYYLKFLDKEDKTCLQRIHELASKRASAPRNFADMTNVLRELIDTCSYSPSSIDVMQPIDIHAAKVFSDMVRQITRSATIFPSISWSRFIDLIETVAANQYIKVGHISAPIQIMDRRDAARLKFDALWITGVAESEWPSVPKPNPFIPRTMQKRALVPGVTHDQMLKEAIELTAHWRSAAKDVVFSYLNQVEKVEAHPSGLLCELTLESTAPPISEAVPTFGNPDLIKLGHPWALHDIPDSVREYQQEYGLSIVDRDNGHASTSLLKHHAECSFKGWAIHHAKFREPFIPPQLFPDAKTRGTLFHKVAEEILKNANSKEQLMTLMEEEQGIEQAIDTVFRLDRTAQALPKQFALHEKKRIQRWMNAWIEVHQKRKPFEVIATEKDVSIEINGLTFTGKVDRIDRIQNSIDVIIDHKTTSSPKKPIDWDPDKLVDTQMPLYALAVKDCDALAYLNVYRRTTDIRAEWHGVGKPTSILGKPATKPEAKRWTDHLGKYSSLTELKEEWQLYLEQLVEDYFEGKALVNPIDETKVCRYCHLSNLCRIYENRAGDQAAVAGSNYA